jgi:LacI family transcriptional regulator
MPEKRTRTIGVIVHRLDSHFITSALEGIQKVTAGWGYEVIITPSQESIEKEVANTRLLFDRRVDGVLASLSAKTRDTAHFTRLITKGVPVVFFDRTGDPCNTSSVDIDHAACGYLAAEHLIRQGCHRIAIATPAAGTSMDIRWNEGFQTALKEHHLMPAARLPLSGCAGEEGAALAKNILRTHPRPDGLFITSDEAAIDCMQMLLDAGVRIPEDIAIVGFNNDPAGRWVAPTLTTIDHPGYEIGATAAITLLDRLSGNIVADRPITTFVSSKLIVRNSSLKRKDGASLS